MLKIFPLWLSLVMFFGATFTSSIMAQQKSVEGPIGQSQLQYSLDLVVPPSPLMIDTGENRKIDRFNFKPYKGTLNTDQFKTDLKPVYYRSNGLPGAIEGRPKGISGNRMEAAHLFLIEAAPLMQIENPSEEFVLSRYEKDKGFGYVFRFGQQYKGVKIFGAEIVMHEKDGVFDFMMGQYRKTPRNVITSPEISPKFSEDIVVEQFDDFQEINDPLGIFADMKRMNTELVLYYPSEDSEAPLLCYHHNYYPNIIERWEVFVDAHNGEIVDKFLNICKIHNHELTPATFVAEVEGVQSQQSTVSEQLMDPTDGPATANAIDLLGQAQLINTYGLGSKFYLLDGSREMFNPGISNLPNEPVGMIWTLDAFNTSPAKNNFNFDHVKSNDNTWDMAASVSAHFNGGEAYKYFRDVHGRNSINGSGGNIISLVNVGDTDENGLDNAFWNGQAIFYGNGRTAFKPLARALDVAGHEMSHGVIQETAGLIYRNESGALNEAYADIFGAMVERKNWLIGEDVVLASAFPSGALRNMQNPHNGAATNDFARGWQPKFYNERFTGSSDNGGVHINSGIINYAYHLFATDPAVGLEKAEKVFFRALSSYLTSSAQFIDCRIAVIRASQELYGEPVANAAKKAFDTVGILGGQGGNYQQDLEANPGNDLIVFTSNQNQGLFLFTPSGQAVANPLSNTDPISRPSVTDRGDAMVFVGLDKKIHYLTIDWQNSTFNEQTLQFQGPNEWRNASISKDGKRLAALTYEINNFIIVVDLQSGAGNAYELINPTFTEGVTTSNVLASDAMEFDYSGEYIMYDALNRITNQSGVNIDFWDIGVIKVWNNRFDVFALPDQVEKLFPALQGGDQSLANPTFSKNSPYIIAFDYTEGDGVALLGLNIETGDIGFIYENTVLCYPSYSRMDDRIVFDGKDNQGLRLRFINIAPDKISGIPAGVSNFVGGTRWGTWFANGSRVLSTLTDPNEDNNLAVKIYPNPASEIITLDVDMLFSSDASLQVYDSSGKIMFISAITLKEGINSINIPLQSYRSGLYFVEINSGLKRTIKGFVKH